jgi:hypothetical protein
MAENKDKELNDLAKQYEKITGMKVIQTPVPGEGKTTYAKDDPQYKK